MFNINLQGIVIDKFKNERNHYLETLEISNSSNEITSIVMDDLVLFEYICIGDSIRKDSGSFECLVFRDDIQFKHVINIPCIDN